MVKLAVFACLILLILKKRPEPLCEFGTISDSVNAKIDGNELMVEILEDKKDDFKCADLSLSSSAKRADPSIITVLEEESILLQYDGKKVSVPLNLPSDLPGRNVGELQVILNTTQVLDKLILISFTYYFFDSGASAIIAVNKFREPRIIGCGTMVCESRL